jgi:hypothetical protein
VKLKLVEIENPSDLFFFSVFFFFFFHFLVCNLIIIDKNWANEVFFLLLPYTY